MQLTKNTESQTRLSFISKEKDIESEFGDFGVRKYNNEIGRFTSIDPLWEKYYSWTPYHYCSNNPVMGSDPSGLLVHEEQTTPEQRKQTSDMVAELRSWNSPTINAVLDKAFGPESNIYLHYFSNNRPVSGYTQSNVGRPLTLEEEWNSERNVEKEPAGITLKSPKVGDMDADVILETEAMNGNYSDDGTLNQYAISPLFLLDELHHAISSTQNNSVNEHKLLFIPLLEEIRNGLINVPSTVKGQIEIKIKEEKLDK
jgi:RHS repeat-associated protein